MFTGIVTGLGRVAAVDRSRRGGARLTIEPPPRYGRFAAGESVAVSGVCLTAVASGRPLTADLSAETLRRTTLGAVSAGDRVNLERALRWGDRLSGHFVMGHVDGVARVASIARAGNSWTFRFAVARSLMRLVVVKGSVSLDGISLTVAARKAGRFDVAVIPETFRRTTLRAARPGSRVNFEADIFVRAGARGWRRAVGPPGAPR
ncbi:MAG: riboflavin synthase [Thermoanaerobaculia bacterium]